MTNATGERNLALIQEVLEVFPETARKERRKHMMISDPQMESVGKCIISNRKSQPGVMTVRGCAYAGSKGGGVWANQRHGPYLARPHRLRPVFARRTAQLLYRRQRCRQLRHPELHL